LLFPAVERAWSWKIPVVGLVFENAHFWLTTQLPPIWKGRAGGQHNV
jgi:hypothetical protein